MVLPGHVIFAISTVMSELVDICICLVWDPFAVAIDVQPGERGGFDTIFTKVPDLVEKRYQNLKITLTVIEDMKIGLFDAGLQL